MSDETVVKQPRVKKTSNESLLKRIAALEAERGVPSDPIAVGKENITTHLAVRAGMLPQHDFSDLTKRAGSINSAEDATAFANAVRLFQDRNGAAGHELAYVRQLAEDLNQTYLDDKTNTDSDVDSEDESSGGDVED
jgi:hypothetical protein